LVFLTPLAYINPFLNWVQSVSSNGSVEVAICHILFKVVTALVLLPFVPQIVKLSEMVFKPKEHESAMRFIYIDKKITENTTATVLQIGSEVERMARLVRENFVLACESYLASSLADEEKIRDNEELINWLNHNISDFMVTVCSGKVPAEESEYIGKLFHVITDLERIGDHAENVLNRTKTIIENELEFSEESKGETKELYENVLELLDRSLGAFVNKKLSDEEEHELHDLENKIDDLTLSAQDNHVQRLKAKQCHTSSGVVYTKLLQDLERVGDHAYNIAWAARKDKDLIRQI